MQMQCKLYVFHGETSAWLERGLGHLRLNDSKEMVPDADADADEERPARSRLIFRAAGTHRVCLNTPVWAGLKPELVTTGSTGSSGSGRMRLLARTDEGLAVFLVVGKQLPDLLELLLRRVRWASEAHEAAANVAPQPQPQPQPQQAAEQQPQEQQPQAPSPPQAEPEQQPATARSPSPTPPHATAVTDTEPSDSH